MKKVMVFFLLLLVACMGFAEPPYVETLNVTLTIAEIPVEVAFTAGPYTDPKELLSSMDKPVDLGSITESETKEASFWASAKTNSATPLTMEIYGTALTRKTADNAGYTSETIHLELSISKDPKAPNSSGQTGSVEFKTAYTSGITWDKADLGLILIEGASDSANPTSDNAAGVAKTGTRALTWKLNVSATVKPREAPTAGSYESYIWLVVGSNSTGA